MASADAVTVKAGTKTFSLKLLLPPGMTLGEFAGLKLRGSFVPGGQPPLQVVSNEIALTLVARKATK